MLKKLELPGEEPHPRDLVFPPQRTIPVSDGNTTIRVRQVSDTHHKGRGFHEYLFNKFIEVQRADRASYWIHSGDVGNPDRNSRREIDETINANRKDEVTTQNEKNKLWVERFIIPKYAPIAATCLGMLAGDHWMLIDGKPCTEYICKRLKIPYLGERDGFANLRFKSRNDGGFQYVIHARHGRGGGANAGTDANALVRQEVGHLADLHLGGHTHKLNCHPVKVEYVNGNGALRDKVVWYMRGGSFLDRPEYAKKAEYAPLPCGWGELELNIGRIYHGSNKSRPFGILYSKASIVAA